MTTDASPPQNGSLPKEVTGSNDGGGATLHLECGAIHLSVSCPNYIRAIEVATHGSYVRMTIFTRE